MINEIVIETTLEARYVVTEDSGKSRNTEIYEDESADNGIFFRIYSWSETGDHSDFDRFVGKNVRLTLEVIDDY